MFTHAAGEIVGHRRELQEAGHRHVVDARLAASGEDRVAVRDVAGRVAAENRCAESRRVGMPGFLGKLQAARLRRAGNDQPNVDRQLALGREVDEILERPAGAGDQHGEFQLGSCDLLVLASVISDNCERRRSTSCSPSTVARDRLDAGNRLDRRSSDASVSCAM